MKKEDYYQKMKEFLQQDFPIEELKLVSTCIRNEYGSLTHGLDYKYGDYYISGFSNEIRPIKELSYWIEIDEDIDY